MVRAALVPLVYGFSGGCYAELTRLRDPLPVAVTVVPWDSAGTRKHGGQSAIGDARSAFTWLHGADAFKSVPLATGADSLTDLVASAMGLSCNAAAVMMGWLAVPLGCCLGGRTDRRRRGRGHGIAFGWRWPSIGRRGRRE